MTVEYRWNRNGTGSETPAHRVSPGHLPRGQRDGVAHRDGQAGPAWLHRLDAINKDIRKVTLRFWDDDQPKKVRVYTPVRYTGNNRGCQNPAVVQDAAPADARDIKRLQPKYGHVEEFAELMRKPPGATGKTATAMVTSRPRRSAEVRFAGGN